MNSLVGKWLSDLQASYWFIPSCMVFAAILLSIFMQWLDGTVSADWLQNLSWLTAARTTGARSVLTVIAGSIIGIAGVTFSITMVAVSYASANFGPRLIGNFMRDRGNQITLGTFIGTFVYCLMILRTVHDASSEDATATFDAFVPHMSILAALLLALLSVGNLIYFIHHIPETINVGNIAARIGMQLRDSVADLFPDTDALQSIDTGPPQSWEERTRDKHRVTVNAGDEGYIQALDEKSLSDLAHENNLLIRVQYRPGDFVIAHDIVLDIWADQDPEEDVLACTRKCFVIGDRKTAYQNSLYLVDQLVEIVARALSPGINDPFTAITCFDWLKVGLTSFIEKDNGAKVREPATLIRLRPISFDRFVSSIFDQSRQYVCSDRIVALHVMLVLTNVAAILEQGERRDVILSQMKRLLEASAKAMDEETGAADVAKRYEQALLILSDPDKLERYRNSQAWFGGRA